MKYYPCLLSIVLCLFSFASHAQVVPLPPIPSQLNFADINVQLDASARNIIAADVKALLSNRKYWEAKLDKCAIYLPLIEGVLIDENVPVDFKYLAVQESSLDPDAVSSSNAVGYWQFKKETATDYGLRVDDMVDERKHILNSTRAAAQYLKKSNAQFNNWVASLYSYYLGAGAIAKNIPTEWSYAREIKLDGKTDKYVLRFFAYQIAIQAFINKYQPSTDMSLLEYANSSGRTLESIAQELGVDANGILTYNRWLNTNTIPNDKPYSLIIPVQGNQLESIKSKIASLGKPNQRDNFAKNDIGFPILNRAEKYDKNILLYEINGLPGIMASNDDNVESLAQKARVSFSSFLRYNDMAEQTPITPGEVYYLAKKSKKAVVPYHTVREGESLWKVSQIYGVRIKNLVKYNRLGNKNTKLQTGRVLWLSKKRPRNQPIEIIQMPQNEWRPNNGKSQPRPSVEEKVSVKPNANKTETIPQTPSERKVYTPKMADTPAEDSKEMGVEIDDKATTKKNTSVNKPTQDTPAKPNRRAPSFNPSDDNKIVVIDNKPTDEKPKQTTTTTKTTPPATSTPKNTPSKNTTVDNIKQITHIVEAGQTYYSISKMYEVSINDILSWNNLTTESKLSVGQKLIIKPINTKTVSLPAEPAYIIHTVSQGETMFSISQKYGVKIDDIKAWNDLTDTTVKIGQQIKIQKK